MSESEASKRYRDEMAAKYGDYSEASQAAKNKRKAKESFSSPDTVEEDLKRENKAVAKGLFGWLFGGGGDASVNVTDDANEVRAASASSQRNRPENVRPANNDTAPSSVVRTDTKLGDDGLMYAVIYYSDGSEDWTRL